MENQEKAINDFQEELKENIDQMHKLIETPYDPNKPDKRIVDSIAIQGNMFTCVSLISGIMEKELIITSRELIHLSQEAAKQTKWVTRLTILLAVIGVIQIFIAFKQDIPKGITNNCTITNNAQVKSDTIKTMKSVDSITNKTEQNKSQK
ncbi:MAG: hypothetical protein ABSF80_11130 [Chitinispirillaceae bacterium]